ncbi:MAG TPA: LON peptidase substrate-binding domain-containing protein [Bacteroidota bacterium]|nr:LON peptidase substrate-binding domain-containing protein [Bacteroidota bacterium]
MPGTWLPLFPLNVVLYPRSALPLHIFEERYKILINECLEQGTPFGILFTGGGGMATVGCSASVRTVSRRYDDGRMDIIVGGERRYRLLKAEDGRAPYLVGEVEYLDDTDETVDRELARSTVDLYNTLLLTAYGEKAALIGVDRCEPGLSYVIAQKSGLEVARRQELLEVAGENDRLRMLHAFLKDLIPRLRRRGELERIIKNDGYLELPDKPEEEK